MLVLKAKRWPNLPFVVLGGHSKLLVCYIFMFLNAFTIKNLDMTKKYVIENDYSTSEATQHCSVEEGYNTLLHIVLFCFVFVFPFFS